jgi:chromosome partition protein MukE
MQEIEAMETSIRACEGLHGLWESESLSKNIVHRLLRGEHVDAYLSREFRFLEEEAPAFEELFRFLGYRLVCKTLGEEIFYYLESATGLLPEGALGRGATFLGLFLVWHFLGQGVAGIEKVGAPEIHERLLATFDFNMLMRVFHPQGRRKLRKRVESEQQHTMLRDWLRKGLRELDRYRFIELKPSPRAWDSLFIYRLPALQRFLDVGRDILQSGDNSDEDTFEKRLTALWTRADVPEESEDFEETSEPWEVA